MKFNIRKVFNDLPPLAKIIFDILLIFIVFCFSFLCGLFILAKIYNLGISEMIQAIAAGEDIEIIRASQILYSIALFILPALTIAFFYEKNICNFLKLNKSAVPINYLYAIIVMIIALPVVNALTVFNANIPFPDALSELYQKFIQMEEKAKLLTMRILETDSFSLLLLNLFMIALLPAIGEELFFRGLLQKHFSEAFKNHHIAILVTAIIFSAFHLQFLSFLPRVFLGIILGYLFFWSKSIWLPIVAHFTNNAFAVIVMYAISGKNQSIQDKIDNFGTNSTTFLFTVSSLLLTGYLLFFIREKNFLKKN